MTSSTHSHCHFSTHSHCHTLYLITTNCRASEITETSRHPSLTPIFNSWVACPVTPTTFVLHPIIQMLRLLAIGHFTFSCVWFYLWVFSVLMSFSLQPRIQSPWFQSLPGQDLECPFIIPASQTPTLSESWVISLYLGFSVPLEKMSTAFQIDDAINSTQTDQKVLWNDFFSIIFRFSTTNSLPSSPIHTQTGILHSLPRRPHTPFHGENQCHQAETTSVFCYQT